MRLNKMPLDPTTALTAAKDIFLQTLEVPVHERAVIVGSSCGDNFGLKSKVLELLAFCDDKDGVVMDTSPLRAALLRDSAQQIPEITPTLLINHSGDCEARYLLLGLKGRDSKSEIYRSIQLSPVCRYVLVKFLKDDDFDEGSIQRIMLVDCTAATLHLPSITSILDGGVDPVRGAFLVMSPVEGVPITEALIGARVSLDKRLNYFVQACRSIELMHDRGCIFRDLEPENVILEDHSGERRVSLVNFGVAVTLAHSRKELRHESELRTEFANPVYRAPEQFQLPDSRLSPQCDVYGLGVLLFEILTGELPFSRKAMADLSYAEKLRYLRGVPPIPPSRLLEFDSIHTSAGWSTSQARQLVSVMKCDLDHVVLKCLEKSPDQRYAQVSKLINDIELIRQGQCTSVGSLALTSRLSRWRRRLTKASFRCRCIV